MNNFFFSFTVAELKRLMRHLLLGGLTLTALLALSNPVVLSPVVQAADNDTFNPELDEYIVEPGDTLWDISDRVVGDPMLWAKVWSMNPEITNPHWIYPGDIIRFYEPETELPTLASLISGQIDLGDVEDLGSSRSEEEVVRAEERPPIEVVNASPIRPYIPKRFINFFITEEELQESGVITNARPDKIILSSGDVVYIRADEALLKGTRLISYRTVKRMIHPNTGRGFGYMTEITGLLTVLTTQGAVTSAVIDTAVDEMERGQLIAPMLMDPNVPVIQVPTKERINATVIGVRGPHNSMGGTGEFVFIDKGTDDGLVQGNQLRVIEFGDPLSGDYKLPGHGIAVMQVLTAEPSAATCLLIGAKKEIHAGAKVQTITTLF